MKEVKEIRTVLVPIDYSETSKRGLENAVRIAKRSQARLVLLHVIPVQGVYDSIYVPEVLWSEETIRRHHVSLGELGRERGGEDMKITTSVVIHPTPHLAILEEIGKHGADLVVMGTHARHGISHFFLGSSAEAVVRHASCPVMTVGPDPESGSVAA